MARVLRSEYTEARGRVDVLDPATSSVIGQGDDPTTIVPVEALPDGRLAHVTEGQQLLVDSGEGPPVIAEGVVALAG